MRVFRIVCGTTLAVWCAVIAAPLIAVYAHSLWREGAVSLSPFSNVLTETRQWGLLRNTLLVASGTAVLSGIIGVPFGFAIEYWRIPGRRWLQYALAIPLLLPPYVSAIVWADWLASSGLLTYGLPASVVFAHTGIVPQALAATILVLALCLYPIPAFAVCAVLRRYDRRIEAPARLVAGRFTTFVSIALPQAKPGIAAGCAAVFVLSLTEFSVPSLLQVNVYAIEIYERFSVTYSSGDAAALALPLLIAGGAALLALSRIALVTLRQRAPERLRTGNTNESDWPTAHGILAILLWTVLVAGTLAPLLALFVSSLPLSSFREVWLTAREEIATTLVLSATAAFVCTALAAVMALCARESPIVSRVFMLSAAAFLASGPLVGAGLIAFWNHDGFRGHVYDSAWILVLAYCARFLFFAYLGALAGLMAIPKRYDEAARTAGACWHSRALHIDLPLLSPMLLAVFGLVFVLSVREIDSAVLVAPPGWSTAGLRIFSLMHYGPSRFVAALCVLTAILILLATLLTAAGIRLVRRRLHVRR